MNTTLLTHQVQQVTTQIPRVLFYKGSNLGMGEKLESCFFTIEEHGTPMAWSILETLARFAEFSEAARARIIADCRTQLRLP